jgi:hypothetical protein
MRRAMNRFMSGLMVGLLCCSFSTSTSAQDAASFNLLNLAGNNVHWQAPADGQALIVTYMLVRDGVESADATTVGE